MRITLTIILTLLSTMLLANGTDPSVGISRSGSMGLALMSSPHTLRGGHISLGWNDQIFSRQSSMEYPINLTIGISDRTEIFASQTGSWFSEQSTISNMGLGMKLHIATIRDIPIGVKASDQRVSFRDEVLGTDLSSFRMQEFALLTRYPVANTHMYQHLGYEKNYGAGADFTALNIGFGLSRPIYREVQMYGELFIQTSEGKRPRYSSSLGAKYFLFGNIQLDVAILAGESEYGTNRIITGGMNISTQKLKAFKVRPGSWSQGFLGSILLHVGFEPGGSQSSDIAPEFYVDTRDRNLPHPPPLDQLRVGSAEATAPEYEVLPNERLPLPPPLEGMKEQEGEG